MKDDWWKNFITYDGWTGSYIAWDESQANRIGMFPYYHQAKEAVLKYAKSLNKKEIKMDFQVGDKVVCLLKGRGEVIAVEECDYPVEVSFVNGTSDLYTRTGYLRVGDEFPCLFYEGTEINIKPAEPKRYPWVNIYVNNFGMNFGVEWRTKDIALKNVHEENNGKYVDTIQLKPKGEEK